MKNVNKYCWEASYATNGFRERCEAMMKMKYNIFVPKKIIYNNNTTICYFEDGSKEIARCAEDEQFVKEVGVMSCIMKKLFNSRNEFKRLVNSGYVQPIPLLPKKTIKALKTGVQSKKND